MLRCMDIIDIVRRLRAVPNKTEFAKASRVSRATLYRLLDGWANPQMRTLEQIERQLRKVEK